LSRSTQFFSCLTALISNPKSYRVVTNPRDIEPLGYRPAGLDFGGLFPKAVWERFAKEVPSAIRILAIGDDEPAEATKEAITANT
jgi:hypothetical protein